MTVRFSQVRNTGEKQEEQQEEEEEEEAQARN